jgi:putative component of toxin-antitoxin plasmid stabilization module
MLAFRRTARFDAWLRRLADQKAKARIAARLISAEQGNFGDTKPAGEGVSEMRINVGRDTGSISSAKERRSTSCSSAATSRRRNATSSRPWPWRAN